MAKTPMLDLNTRIEGLAELNRLIDEIIKRAAAPFDKAPAREIRDAYIRRVENVFRTQGKSVGGWPALNPIYAAQKRTRYPGRPMLVAEGSMKEALTRKGHSQFVFERRPSKVVLGADDLVSKYHQEGTEHMDARVIFKADRGWGKEVAEIVGDYVMASQLERLFSVL